MELSKRELEVIELTAAGCTESSAADKLFISEHTVHTHRHNILKKLEAKTMPHAVAKAFRQGIIK